MALGKNIKKWRKRLNLTQEAVAARANMSQAALSALERRDSKTSEFLSNIAAALGLSIAELLNGSEYNSGTQVDGTISHKLISVQEPISAYTIDDPESREILEIYKAMTPEERKATLEFLRTLSPRQRLQAEAVAAAYDKSTKPKRRMKQKK